MVSGDGAGCEALCGGVVVLEMIKGENLWGNLFVFLVAREIPRILEGLLEIL